MGCENLADVFLEANFIFFLIHLLTDIFTPCLIQPPYPPPHFRLHYRDPMVHLNSFTTRTGCVVLELETVVFPSVQQQQQQQHHQQNRAGVVVPDLDVDPDLDLGLFLLTSASEDCGDHALEGGSYMPDGPACSSSPEARAVRTSQLSEDNCRSLPTSSSSSSPSAGVCLERLQPPSSSDLMVDLPDPTDLIDPVDLPALLSAMDVQGVPDATGDVVVSIQVRRRIVGCVQVADLKCEHILRI